MASVKHTFYSIPINIDHQKYLKFYWNQFFKYTGMPEDTQKLCIRS